VHVLLPSSPFFAGVNDFVFAIIANCYCCSIASANNWTSGFATVCFNTLGAAKLEMLDTLLTFVFFISIMDKRPRSQHELKSTKFYGDSFLVRLALYYRDSDGTRKSDIRH